MTKFSNVARFKVKPPYVEDFQKHISDLPS